jgi:hypothetical protein
MNKHHPLDGVFQRKLRDLEAETPMHILGQINQKRSRKHRFINKMKQRKPVVALIGAVALTGITLLLFSEQQVQVNSFPVPVTGSDVLASSDFDNVASDPGVVDNMGIAPFAKHKNKSTNNTSLAGTTTSTTQVLDYTSILEYTEQTSIPNSIPQSNVFTDLPDHISTTNLLSSDQIQSTTPQSFESEAIVAAVKPILEASPQTIMSPLLKTQKTDGLGMEVSPTEYTPMCAAFNSTDWSFAIDLLASPDYVIREITALDPELESYVQSREESEKYQTAFSAGMRVSMIADNGLAFRTGINYSRINEKFTYFNGTEVITSIKEEFDNDGNLIGFDTITEIGARYKVTHNRLQMLDIPILVGYEVNFNKLSVSINGGAQLNLISNQRGDILSPQDGTPMSIDSDDPDAYPAFKRSVGLGWYGSLGIAYQASDDLQLLVEPHFKVFPKSFTQEQFGISQRYSSIGISLGIRKHL